MISSKVEKLGRILTVMIILLVGCSEPDKEQNTGEVHLVIERYDNEKLYRIGYKSEDQKVGEWRIFRRERLFSILNYYEGIQHGKEISYESCTGKVLEEGYYDMGERVGLWYWYNNGELVAVREFKNDTSEIVYHNPKFKSDGPPPPPDERYNSDCDEFKDY